MEKLLLFILILCIIHVADAQIKPKPKKVIQPIAVKRPKLIYYNRSWDSYRDYGGFYLAGGVPSHGSYFLNSFFN